MFSASTKSVSLIQYLTIILSVGGIFFFNFTLENYLTLLIFYFLYSGIGVSMMLHRYYSHKSFDFKYPIVKWLFTWFSIVSGRGSMIGWVYIHRLHHTFSDTETDPHYSVNGLKEILFPSYDKFIKKVNLRLVKDMLSKENIFIDKHYLLLLFVWVILLGLVGIEFLYFAWILPVSVTHLTFNTFLYSGHKLGYRNYQTRDNSKNSYLYALLLWGEGWHNNHHNNPGKWKLTEKWWELDVVGQVIEFVKK